MPRKLKTGGKKLIRDWTKFHTILTTGYDYFGDLGTDHPPREELKAAWRELGASILEEFAAEPKRRAGTRPYFWWIEQGFDHRPDDAEQRQYLEEHGLLSEEERRELSARDTQRAAMREGLH